MAKCLRCGAGNEWTQGNVKDEPLSSDAVLGDGDKNEKCKMKECEHFNKHPDDYITLICFHCGHYNKDAFA